MTFRINGSILREQDFDAMRTLHQLTRLYIVADARGRSAALRAAGLVIGNALEPRLVEPAIIAWCRETGDNGDTLRQIAVECFNGAPA